MPIKLRKKRRQGRESTNWYLRGTVRGHRVDESTGTSDRAAAEAIRVKREAEILDRSVFGQRETLTFAVAADKYLDAGGDLRFIAGPTKHFKGKRVDEIEQRDLDQGARKLYPNASNATRNRQFYTPVISVLRYAGVAKVFKRPKAKRKPVKFAEREWIAALLPHCNQRLAALVVFMHLTGRRVTECTNLYWEEVNLRERTVTIRKTKNGKPFAVYLSGPVFEAVANLPGRKGKVFGYASRSSIYGPLRKACKDAKIPYLSPHALGRHSFATHALRSGANMRELMEAGGWDSIQSVVGYTHVVPEQVRRTMDAVSGHNLGKGKASR